MPRLQFEAVTLGLMFAVGLLVLPIFIWIAGRYTLGDYAHGGPLALYFDFYKGLIQLRPSCWIAVIGPFAFLSLLRLFRLVLRRI